MNNKCVVCYKPRERNGLCKKHLKILVLDKETGMYRKKRRMDSRTRLIDNKVKFHNTERSIVDILKYLFGRKEVIQNVYPLWAKSHKGVLFEYDMAVPAKRILIEYNGNQHYIYPNIFHKTRKEFQDQKKRDRIKIRLAKENGWNLIIFKYTQTINIQTVKDTIKGN